MIRKGDSVKILSGKDRGRVGKVLAVNSKSGRILVEGLNIVKRHQRPRKSGEKGQRLELPAPLHPARLMLVCPHCNKSTRTGSAKTEKGEKIRVCKNCGKTIG